MSRTRTLRRLERLLALAEALESLIDTRGLEGLSDQELEALEREQDPGVACVHRGMADYIEDCDCLDRAKALKPGGRSEVQYLACRLHRGEQPGPRPAPEPVVLNHEEPSLDPEPPSAAEEPSEPGEVQEEPPVLPRIRRSTDLPESKAKERARLFELDTVRLAEPGDVPGSGFRWRRPPRRRSRRH